MRILLAVDGSDAASRATRHVIALSRALTDTPELHVVYADPPMLQAVAVSLGVAGLARFHEENAHYATRKTRAQLARADVAYAAHHPVAEPADAILAIVKSARIELVVMGSHGRSAIRSALMGSVAAKGLANCATPLTIVR